MEHSSPPKQFRAVLLSALLVLSGFCGISYEVLYARLFNTLIGDQFAVYTAILLSFLLGIGLGTLFAYRFWPHLWLIEASIGAYALAVACNIKRIDDLLYALGFSESLGFAWSIAVVVVLLVLPAFLIGATLPLFAGYLGKVSGPRSFSRAYALYNCGAFLTALAIEFWLLRVWGLRTSIAVIAGLNCLTATLLALVAWPLRKAKRAKLPSVVMPRSHLIALMIASIGSAVFQLTMIRLLEFLFGPFHETFALALAAVLLGIALGSALVRGFRLTFGALMATAVFGCILLLATFTVIGECYAALYAVAAERPHLLPIIKFAITFLLMAVPATCFGATVPALLIRQRDIARDSGRLLSLSAFANVGGFLIMAFVLHPLLEYGLLLVAVAAMACLSLCIYFGRVGYRTAATAAAFLLVLAAYAACWEEDFLYVGHTSFHSLDELRAARRELAQLEAHRGRQDVMAITWFDGKPYYFINGYISIPLSSPSEKLVGALSSIFAPRPDNALVLGVGSGATASTVGLLFDHVDAVEINPVVISNLWRLAKYNFELPAMQNVRIICDDALHYLKRGTDRYSLVLNTVTTPLYFSSSKLYTRDFFESVRNRLTKDGLYVTWLDMRVGDRGVDIILKTLAQVFRHCAVACVKSQYFLLLCSNNTIEAHLIKHVTDCEMLKADLLANYEVYLDWLPFSLLVTDAYGLIDNTDVPINTLDYPSLEFAMSGLAKRSIRGFIDRLTAAMDVEAIRAAYPSGQFNLAAAYLRANEWLGDCPITRRWEELARASDRHFRQHVRDERLKFAKEYALRVRTLRAYTRYASLLAQRRLYKQAAHVLQLALAEDHACQECQLQLAYCLEQLGQLKEALRLYRRAVEEDGQEPRARAGLARVLLGLGRKTEALYEIDSSIFEGTDSAELHYLRGRALEQLGFITEATSEYKEALRRNPGFEDAFRGLVRAVRADALVETTAHISDAAFVSTP